VKVAVYGPYSRVGIVEGSDIVDVEGAYAKLAREIKGHPSPYAAAAATAPSNLERFIELGDQALQAAQEAIEYLTKLAGDRLGPKGEQLLFPFNGTKLHAPLAQRGVKLCMAGANYADHLFDMMHAQDPTVTMDQVKERSRQHGIGGFWKLSALAADPEQDITYPAKTEWLDYEGEVAIVFGKRARDAKASDLASYIWGYTLQNDWSARDQRDNVVGTLSMNLMKNWDGCVSIGPVITVGEIKDPQDVAFQTKVNGEVRQNGNTRDMTFSFADYLEFVTRDITFNPGDMIAAGTCKGTAMDSTPRLEGGAFSSDKLFLRVGDMVEVSSPAIGVLRNRIVSKS
jgi:2-keto-4-pentenoate hydratase/2-oxohepta-3-ene-1,7-dioic acid hydratase in catechol pathway